MQNKNQIEVIILWTARIWGSIMLLFGLIMFGGEIVEHLSGKPSFSIDSVSDLLVILFFPAGTLIGLGIAWKWEGLGGLVIIGGIICSQMIKHGTILFDPLTFLFGAPGLLFLIYWYLSRHKKETPETI